MSEEIRRLHPDDIEILGSAIGRGAVREIARQVNLTPSMQSDGMALARFVESLVEKLKEGLGDT